MSETAAANRRNSHRRAPRAGVRIECRRDAVEIAVVLLDASQTGLSILVKEPLPRNQEVVLTLQGPAATAAVSRVGVVARCLPHEEGSWSVGVQFRDRLLYRDLIALTEIA